jgi:hypothetical protein
MIRTSVPRFGIVPLTGSNGDGHVVAANAGGEAVLFLPGNVDHYSSRLCDCADPVVQGPDQTLNSLRALLTHDVQDLPSWMRSAQSLGLGIEFERFWK